MAVPARISIVTLGVADLPRAVAFYEALGWERAASSMDEIAWFHTADTNLGLFPTDELAADANLPAERGPFDGVTLAINVETATDVDRCLAEAVAAGGRLLKAATNAVWGGRSGYFADPDGHPWEVAHNPGFAIQPDGRVTIP
jgi:catechol 2,3-dioxygenase-like lactoylglutathione lyase family enzyme